MSLSLVIFLQRICFYGFDRKIRYQCFHFVDDITPLSALRNRFNEIDMAMTHSVHRGIKTLKIWSQFQTVAVINIRDMALWEVPRACITTAILCCCNSILSAFTESCAPKSCDCISRSTWPRERLLGMGVYIYIYIYIYMDILYIYRLSNTNMQFRAATSRWRKFCDSR